ncbi:MAG: phosphate ABC transporter permease subunit PstC [Bacteroidetes bacterium]|nr:phosphate ABC transporter permease subunit PstC [Bacteroidota bacterium]MBK9525318.1 phosphate ABC transporter permease subunit PstC [Bacteroidota bacterium]MBK9542415.1 phosphate ABC transporter permease subunit PstC [Bacteroidota bacterium]MBP6401979.1 phosphate ABC transporter permease subunit PstC [Bacteroidia bacterium]MBP6648187.1 phosphate ABC transporter permease subunit PstC [Bacteroidia bacterium]
MEGLLLISGSLTSITVLLIVIFLFKEGLGLFTTSPMENKNVIVVNKLNPVEHLTAGQIKKIFDQEITNWKDLGGKNDTILLFTINDLSNYFSEEEIGENFEYLPEKLNSIVDSIPNLLAVYTDKYLVKDLKGKIVKVDKNNIPDFILGREWFPTAEPAVQLGVLPLILGTLLVSVFAILFALPIGIATSIYMAEVANERVRKILKPIIELLAGIPSVVYGFFGLIVIVPLIHDTFNLPVGETALAGSIVLAIMALPTIITVSEDAIRNTPRSMKEASLALGANRWQTIHRVVLPYSMSGITAAAILGIGRAIGETMAVLMVTGNAAVMPHSLLQPVRTIPATIAAELGEAPQGGVHYQALFALGCILFILTLLINIWVEYVSSKQKFKK